LLLGRSPSPLVRQYIPAIVAAVNAATSGSFLEVEIPLPAKKPFARSWTMAAGAVRQQVVWRDWQGLVKPRRANYAARHFPGPNSLDSSPRNEPPGWKPEQYAFSADVLVKFRPPNSLAGS